MQEKPLIIVAIVIGFILVLKFLLRGGQPHRRAGWAANYEEIAEIFGGSPVAGGSPAAVEWARTELESRGIDPLETPAAAMKALRSARHGLSIGASKVLVDALRTAA